MQSVSSSPIVLSMVSITGQTGRVPSALRVYVSEYGYSSPHSTFRMFGVRSLYSLVSVVSVAPVFSFISSIRAIARLNTCRAVVDIGNYPFLENGAEKNSAPYADD